MESPMELSACVHCGNEIDSKGIHFRGKTFCSDECCEEFEAELVDKGGPEMVDLADDDFEPEDLGDELGYRNGEDDPEELLDDDDDFKIEPDDF